MQCALPGRGPLAAASCFRPTIQRLHVKLVKACRLSQPVCDPAMLLLDVPPGHHGKPLADECAGQVLHENGYTHPIGSPGWLRQPAFIQSFEVHPVPTLNPNTKPQTLRPEP